VGRCSGGSPRRRDRLVAMRNAVRVAMGTAHTSASEERARPYVCRTAPLICSFQQM
jgi:hypothetical protein